MIAEATHMLEDYRVRMGDFAGVEQNASPTSKGGDQVKRRLSIVSPTHNAAGLGAGFGSGSGGGGAGGDEEDSDEEEPEERPPEDLDMLLVLTIMLSNMIYIIEGTWRAREGSPPPPTQPPSHPPARPPGDSPPHPATGTCAFVDDVNDNGGGGG